MPQALVSEKGSIVIPQEIRKKYDIQPASKVEVLDVGGRVMILPIPRNLIKIARGSLHWKESALKTLHHERRQELKKDHQRTK